MSAPLDGLLVVSLDQAVAAPFTTSRLADAGARVIKVERPGGDFARGYDTVANGLSAYFVWLNRGKESICLDIKNVEDGVLLEAMIARADIFVQNLAPGACARAGFGSEALRERYPMLMRFANNPLFRGFWKGTERLFINALYMGQMVEKPNYPTN